MARQLRTIQVEEGSDLAHLLESAECEPVILEKDGTRYRLARESVETENIWSGYDPDKVRKTVAKLAGRWADLHTDALIENLYRAREEGTRPASRP